MSSQGVSAVLVVALLSASPCSAAIESRGAPVLRSLNHVDVSAIAAARPHFHGLGVGLQRNLLRASSWANGSSWSQQPIPCGLALWSRMAADSWGASPDLHSLAVKLQL